MGNITAEIRERKEILRDIRGLLSEQRKGSDQALKLADRLIRRKRSLPTIEDLDKLADSQSRVKRAFDALTQQFARADKIFETM